MLKHPLDFSTRKALEVQLGEVPGREISEVIFQLAARIEQLERTKVDKTLIVPSSSLADTSEPTARQGFAHCDNPRDGEIDF